MIRNNSINMEQVIRIADIEVYPEYLDEFFKAATEIAQTSVKEEVGVICLFPCQLKEDKTHFRVIEVYASPAAYQHHIQTQYFLKYKQETQKMVKSLKLNDLTPLTPKNMQAIFSRIKEDCNKDTKH